MEHDYVALACSFACDHTNIVMAMHLTVKKYRTTKLHFLQYSQTCVKQPPKESTKSGCLRQVAA